MKKILLLAFLIIPLGACKVVATAGEGGNIDQSGNSYRAVPQNGYTFESWSGWRECGDEPQCLIDMPGYAAIIPLEVELKANFVKASFFDTDEELTYEQADSESQLAYALSDGDFGNEIDEVNNSEDDDSYQDYDYEEDNVEEEKTVKVKVIEEVYPNYNRQLVGKYLEEIKQMKLEEAERNTEMGIQTPIETSPEDINLQSEIERLQNYRGTVGY